MDIYTPLSSPARLYIKQCPHCDLKYVGRTERDDIELYTGSGTRWKAHIKKHNIRPIHVWHSKWFYDTSITEHALKISRYFNIVKNSGWANLIEEDGLNNGGAGFITGSEASIKRGKSLSKTKNSKKWKETVGKETSKKLSDIRLEEVWKKTVGKNAFDKMKITVNSEEWKNTTGKEKSNKISKTQNDEEWKLSKGKIKSERVKRTVNSEEWKSTVGEQKSSKISETKNSKEWKNTVGKEQSEKMKKMYQNEEWLSSTGVETSKKLSDIRNNPEWIIRNTKKCEYCNRNFQISNYKRWHGEKCKLNK